MDELQECNIKGKTSIEKKDLTFDSIVIKFKTKYNQAVLPLDPELVGYIHPIRIH